MRTSQIYDLGGLPDQRFLAEDSLPSPVLTRLMRLHGVVRQVAHESQDMVHDELEVLNDESA